MAVRQRTTRKKSKASSIQPRKPARRAARWPELVFTEWAMDGVFFDGVHGAGGVVAVEANGAVGDEGVAVLVVGVNEMAVDAGEIAAVHGVAGDAVDVAIAGVEGIAGSFGEIDLEVMEELVAGVEVVGVGKAGGFGRA